MIESYSALGYEFQQLLDYCANSGLRLNINSMHGVVVCTPDGKALLNYSNHGNPIDTYLLRRVSLELHHYERSRQT